MSPALAGEFFTTGPPGKPPSRGLIGGNKYGTNKDAGHHAGLEGAGRGKTNVEGGVTRSQKVLS